LNQADVELLKARINQKVQFHYNDGEIVTGVLHCVSEAEREDVIYDLIAHSLRVKWVSPE
jgi:hypothetical protein